jgi:predicted RNase H-like HicB family nuclease
MGANRQTPRTASRGFTVFFEAAERGAYYAHVPALDITTEGRTLKEAKEMVRDAIQGYLQAAKKLKKKIPNDVTVERFEVTA